MPPQTLNVLPPSKFPSIEISGSGSLVGEGRGPFDLPIIMNEGDGGELCLGTETIQIATHDGTLISGTVRFDSGETCVTDFASSPEALIVEFDTSAFVEGSKFGLGFVAAQPLGLEVRVDVVEADFVAGLDPKQAGVVHVYCPSHELECSSYTGRDDGSQSCYDHSRRR